MTPVKASKSAGCNRVGDSGRMAHGAEPMGRPWRWRAVTCVCVRVLLLLLLLLLL